MWVCSTGAKQKKRRKSVFRPVWGVYDLQMFLFLFLSFHQLSRLQNVRQRSHFCPGVFLFLLTVLCEATKSAIFKKWHFFSWLESLSFLPHRHLRGTLPTPRRRRSPRAFLSSDQSMGWSWKGYEDLIFSALRSFPAALSRSDKKVDDNMTENTGARSGESKLS